MVIKLILSQHRLASQFFIVILFGLILCDPSFALSNLEGIQIYQKNIYLSAEHKQKLAEDISRYHHADNIWDVLREEFTLAHYEDNPFVQDKIDWYMHNQDYLLRSATRAAPYLYYILQQVKKRHLPAELVLIPIVESGYNPFSLSIMGAAGIWQLMPATAADLGVRQDWWFDGRRDVITSTRAALNHFAYLENVYEGNWLLAFAAYDTGEGNLHAAIVKNIRYGRDTDFWSLPVATETKNYVPSLLALAVIISHPDQYPVYFPPVKNAPYLAQVDTGAPLNLKYAASLAGMRYKNLIQLNPGYSHQSIPHKGPYKLILPIENVEQFTENLIKSPLNPHTIHTAHENLFAQEKQMSPPLMPHVKEKPSRRYVLQPGDTIYIVREKDTIESIARHFHVNVMALSSTNFISETNLAPGKSLIIPTHTPNEMSSGLQPGDTIYVVRRGDRIEDIASKFHTSAASIRLANLLKSNFLQEGERLVVPTHLQG